MLNAHDICAVNFIRFSAWAHRRQCAHLGQIATDKRVYGQMDQGEIEQHSSS